MEYRIRRAHPDDVDALHDLMAELARFERYHDRFAITPEIVLEVGFRKQPPDFLALVAEGLDPKSLVGMAVTYVIPYTLAARPVLVVKELFVAQAARGVGVGESLMRSIARLALGLNCVSVKWQVAPWNDAARRFYERLGAVEDREWVDYFLNEQACRNLAGEANE